MLTKVVIVIIKDKSGRFFVHQRRSDKNTFPNLYGLGAGGHIEEGEDKFAAAKRELFEETDLKAEIKYLFKVKFKNFDTNNLIDVFETIVNNEINICTEEWQWSGWMKKEKVDDLLRENKLCPDTAKTYKKYVQLNCW